MGTPLRDIAGCPALLPSHMLGEIAGPIPCIADAYTGSAADLRSGSGRTAIKTRVPANPSFPNAYLCLSHTNWTRPTSPLPFAQALHVPDWPDAPDKPCLKAGRNRHRQIIPETLSRRRHQHLYGLSRA